MKSYGVLFLFFTTYRAALSAESDAKSENGHKPSYHPYVAEKKNIIMYEFNEFWYFVTFVHDLCLQRIN